MKNICHNFYRKIIFNASALYKMTIIPLQGDNLSLEGRKALKIQN